MSITHPHTISEAKHRYLGSRQTRADWAQYVADTGRIRAEIAETAMRMAALRALRITDHQYDA